MATGIWLLGCESDCYKKELNAGELGVNVLGGIWQ